MFAVREAQLREENESPGESPGESEQEQEQEQEQDLSKKKINFLLGDVDGAFCAFLKSKGLWEEAREEQGP